MRPLFRNLFAVSQAFFCLTQRKKPGLSKFWKYHYKDQTTTYNSLLRCCFPPRDTAMCPSEPHPSVTMKNTVTSLLSLFPAHSALTTLQTPELCHLQIVLQSQRWCDQLRTAAFSSTFAYKWLGNHMLSVADQGEPFLQSEMCHRHIKAMGWCRGNWMKPYSLSASPDVVLNEIMVPTDL